MTQNTSYVQRPELWVNQTALAGIKLIENTRILLEMQVLISWIPEMKKRWFKKVKETYSNEEIRKYIWSQDSWASLGRTWAYRDMQTLQRLAEGTFAGISKDNVCNLSVEDSQVLERVKKHQGKEAIKGAKQYG